MSDNFSDDDSFALDDAAWQQIDALSSAAPPSRPPPPSAAAARRGAAGQPARPPPAAAARPSSAYARANAVAGLSRPAGPTHPSNGRPPPGELRQTTLLGGYAAAPPEPSPGAGVDHTGDRPLDTHDGQASQGMVQKTGKVWDRSAVARDAAKAAKGKGKGRARWDDDGDEADGFDDDDDGEDDDGGFDQFPAPSVPLGTLPSELKHALDEDAAQTWVYPINLPLRDYQYNIVRASLFRNTLAALPTGLGKTFIAGCVMLNYARWYPTAKIVFVAPTKPLVNQQAQAFPETCGFLNSKITVLNGDTSGDKRAKLYPTKQVFFMTAQTMMNDLQNGRLDPRDVVLLVVDEAHKATGNHAYVQVVRYLQAHTHLFRILALTATPSGKPEGVQLLIDRLHLSHIEIRDEESLDLRQYVHKKITKLILVHMTPNVLELKDMLEVLMRPIMEQAIKAGVLREYERDPTKLHCFRIHMLSAEAARKKNFSLRHPLMKLEAYARAMGYLLEHSVSMFQASLAGQQTKKDSATSKNKELRAIDAAVERMRAEGGFVAHAKMDRLKGLLLEHFAPREDGDGRGDLDPDTTRVMVFCSFRACLEEIVLMLNQEQPLLKAVSFVGQSTDKDGRKGLKQSEQIQVIKDFKAGKYNIMVATSIGEEGLDIGSVDKIICYDASKSSVRMLQRVGRTGRKREGIIYVLMGEGREEDSWNKAKDNYTSVQEAITNGAYLELYEDVPRLLPTHIKPTCVQEVVPIDETVPDFLKAAKTTRKASGGGKQTKLTAVSSTKVAAGKHGALVPDGAAAGFVFARALTSRTAKGTDSDLDDDSDDEAISRGLQVPKPKPQAAAAAASSFGRTASTGRALGTGKLKARSGVLPPSSDGQDAPKPLKRARTEPAAVSASSRPTKIASRPPPALPLIRQDDGPIEILEDDDDDEVMVIDESLYSVKAPDPASLRAASGPIRHRSTSRTVPSAATTGSRKQPTSLRAPPPPAPQQQQQQYVGFSPSPSPPPIRPSQRVHLSVSPQAIKAPFRALPAPAHLPVDVAAQAGFDEIDPRWILDDDDDDGEDNGADDATVAHLPADVAARAGFEEIDPRWILDDGDDDGRYDTSFVPSPAPATVSRPSRPSSNSAGPPPAASGASGSRAPLRPTPLQYEVGKGEPATPAPQQRPSKAQPAPDPRPSVTDKHTIGRLSNEEGQDLSWVLRDDDSDSYDSPPVQSRPAKRARPTAAALSSSDHVEMPPPASTRKLSTPASASANAHQLESPFLPTQPVRRGGFRPKLRAAVHSSPADSPEDAAAGGPSRGEPITSTPVVAPPPPGRAGPASRRLFEQPAAAAPRRKDPSWYRGAVPDDVRRFFDKAAGEDRAERQQPPEPRANGGDASSGTLSDDGSAVDDEETSSDRAFAGEFQPTQAPRGYDQQRAYMQSVLSPRDGGRAAPAFGTTRAGQARPYRRFERVESEGPDVDGGAEDDDWDYGTFVVDDEDPLVYDRSSEADEWMRKP